jgi:regulator of extracellular matrix RemA (YlzA/DUF370 family)
MKMLRVGASYFVNATDIEIIQAWGNRAAAKEVQRAKDANCYHDATHGKKLLAILTLKNGWVVGAPFTPEALVQRATITAPDKSTLKRETSAAEA